MAWYALEKTTGQVMAGARAQALSHSAATKERGKRLIRRRLRPVPGARNRPRRSLVRAATRIKGIDEIGIVGLNAAVFHATGKRIRDLAIHAEKLL